MSLSKVASLCNFCKEKSGIYSCPKCDCKYCSVQCYKHPTHSACSEAFYQDWVEKSLENKFEDLSERNKMIDILKRQAVDDDEDILDDASSLEERFADLDLKGAGENDIWQRLTKEEKIEFGSLLKNEQGLQSIIQVKQPWWTDPTLKLVIELNDEITSKSTTSDCPPLPIGLKKLSDMTSKPPSDCIQYNFVNILYAYAFLTRYYNCDLRDFLEETLEYILNFSPVLSRGHTYFSFEESVQDSIRIILDSQLEVPLEYVKHIISDVINIVQGPNNAPSSTFALCVLNDIAQLIMEFINLCKKKNETDKNKNKMLKLAIKKLEYFMCWVSDDKTDLVRIQSALSVITLPDILNDNCENVNLEQDAPKKHKILIEELS